MKKWLSALVMSTLFMGAGVAEAYNQWQGYCANRTDAYDNAELTRKPGVQYVGAGDNVTVLDEYGNAYLVRYPLINGKTKDRWVPKYAISGKPSTSSSAFVAGVEKAVQATQQALSFQQWQGYCANRTDAYDNAELTQKPGVQYVGAGDNVTVLGESGNAYLVRYPLINGKTKDRWVPKYAITRVGGSSRSDTSPVIPTNTIVGSAPTRQETTSSYQQWQGYCANRTNAYDNAELTQKPGVQYVGAGDTVTVLGESGNAYLVRYPLINGKTKDRWVPKYAISGKPSTSSSGSAAQVQDTQKQTASFQQWQGYCANRTNAYDNAELTKKTGVQYVGAGDTVTVLGESGNSYLVRYPLINGKTKEKWVPKYAISQRNGNSGSSTNVIVANGSLQDKFNALRGEFPTGTSWKGKSYNGASQCHGFALLIGQRISNKNARNWDRDTNSDRSYVISQLKPGDIVRLKGDKSGHSIVIMSINGNNVTFVDCNSYKWDNDNCLIKWWDEGKDFYSYKTNMIIEYVLKYPG